MLNKTLYDRLNRLFGDVCIANENCGDSVRTLPNWHGSGRLQTRVEGVAEQYKVPCPFCSDSRPRLYIHYRYGTQDETTGYRFSGLVCCQHEDCLSEESNRLALWDMIINEDMSRIPLQIRRTPCSDDIPTTPSLPANLTPVMSSRVPSRVTRYLRHRHFDPVELWKYWRIYYCEQCFSCRPKLANRLVVPYTAFEGEDSHQVRLVGWQARRIGESEYEHKYLTMRGLSVRQNLYGLTWAVAMPGPLILCEGVTDVWRLKFNAVAAFGKSVNVFQLNLIRDHVGDRPVVIFFDRDAPNEASKTAAKLAEVFAERRMQNRVEIVVPPRGKKDVGECGRTAAWLHIAKSLGKSLGRLKVDLDCDQVPTHPPECKPMLKFKKMR